ncbi:MAG: hypothetical protein OJF49_003321 [Ktedonobacterales bacterium]|jgi:hypothetical protein|nr:MAG: hypothetical protein OJF49_003321 [Ktedonobacterales bacterium]
MYPAVYGQYTSRQEMAAKAGLKPAGKVDDNLAAADERGRAIVAQ